MVVLLFIFPRAGRSDPWQRFPIGVSGSAGAGVPDLKAWPAVEPFPAWWPACELLAAEKLGRLIRSRYLPAVFSITFYLLDQMGYLL